jgi:hypothetical protein
MKERLEEELEEETEKVSLKVPDDLEAKVTAKLREQPDITWHRAVRLIVDSDGDNKRRLRP